MATTTNVNPTLLDFTRLLDPKGKIDRMVELLAERNDIIRDMVWMEGNLLTGHRTTVLTGLPTPTWRKLYGGVQPTKGTTAQVTVSCGMLEAFAKSDCALADLGNQQAAFRAKQVRMQLLGMEKEFTDTVFKGNESTEPEAFTGFGPQFNSTTAANGQQIVSASTTNSSVCTSIWLVVWGENSVYGVFPQGSKAGWMHEDLGRKWDNDIDGAGGSAMVYLDHMRWDAGLCVADWRQVARIPDIIAAELKGDLSSGPDLPDLISQAIDRIDNLSGGKPVLYMNRQVRSVLRRQITKKTQTSTLMRQDATGRAVMECDGIPVHICDSLTFTEDDVD